MNEHWGLHETSEFGFAPNLNFMWVKCDCGQEAFLPFRVKTPPILADNPDMLSYNEARTQHQCLCLEAGVSETCAVVIIARTWKHSAAPHFFETVETKAIPL